MYGFAARSPRRLGLRYMYDDMDISRSSAAIAGGLMLILDATGLGATAISGRFGSWPAGNFRHIAD